MDKVSTLLFVINPKSGDSDKSTVEPLIKKHCSKNSKEFVVFHTTGKNDLEKLNAEIKRISPESVIACGGDGTVNLVANVLIDTDINLGILPLGSANGLAYELEIPDEIEEALSKIFTANPKPMDSLWVNNKYLSLHLSDVGFNAEMIKDFESSGERGMIAYAKAFVNSLFQKEAAQYELNFNGKIISTEAEMVVFANASSYGTGAVINPGSRIDDGHFELIVFKPIPLHELPSLTIESFLGDIQNSPYVEIFKTTDAKIKCKSPKVLQVDGEVIGDVKELSLTILKTALKVIY